MTNKDLREQIKNVNDYTDNKQVRKIRKQVIYTEDRDLYRLAREKGIV